MIFQEPVASLNPSFTVGFQIEEVLRFNLGMDPRRPGRGRWNCSRPSAFPSPRSS
jgi:dipeptide transport system ATP-binding protein